MEEIYMERIIALDRNHKGDIISFQTSEGRIISYMKAVDECKLGVIEGLKIDSVTENAQYSPGDDQIFAEFPNIY
jgi:hypothetical protein